MPDEPALVHVRIGKLAVGRSPTILKATLGSCVGVALLWRERAVYGLAHCLLPQAPDPSIGIGARYVDQAVASLLRMLEAGPEHHAQLEAHLAGGGNMTQRGQVAGHVIPVGQLNSEAALRVLEKQGIALHSTDLGGVHARQMHVDCASGSVSVVRVPAP